MSRDTSFYYSFLVLPPRKRSAIIAVWDFCRAVDDAVDEAPDGASAEHRLGAWRDELAAVYGGRPSTREGLALQPYVREYGLPREQFDALVDGVEMDLRLDQARAESGCERMYPDFESLVQYCSRVASAVGLICVEIFGYRDPRTRDYAVTLGMALQLTNIIRDVAADLRHGRVYLPADDLDRFGVTPDDLRAGRVTPDIRALLRFECERAHEFYRRAAEQLPAVDARSLVAAEIMGAIYLAILRRVEQADYDVFTSRIRVPRPRRAVIALRVWFRRLAS